MSQSALDEPQGQFYFRFVQLLLDFEIGNVVKVRVANEKLLVPRGELDGAQGHQGGTGCDQKTAISPSRRVSRDEIAYLDEVIRLFNVKLEGDVSDVGMLKFTKTGR